MDKSEKRKKISDGIRTSRTSTIRTKVRSFEAKSVKTKKSEPKIIFEDDIFETPAKKIKHRSKSNKNNFLKKIFKILSGNKKLFKWIIFIVLYFMVLFFVFSSLEKTKIKLTPKIENIEETKLINVYSNPKNNELGFNIIALSDSRQKTLSAGESVQVSEKASGVIKIFNNYSTEPQRLSPETRFESVSGKIFKLGKDGVTVPGKLDGNPGGIEVTVYADQPGPDYNIDLTDFTIPGFKDVGLDQKFDNIYALSVKAFSGGFEGERFIIGEDQEKEAILELESELKELLVNRLSVEKTDRVLLVDNSIQIVFKEIKIDKEENQKITLKQDAKIFALLVEKTQLEKYLQKTYFPDTYKDQIALLDFDNISFNYKGIENIDFSKLEKLNIEMKLNTVFVWNIDTNLVNESLVGLSKINTIVILNEFDEIQFAQIDIEPFWRNNISKDIKNIDINIVGIKR